MSAVAQKPGDPMRAPKIIYALYLVGFFLPLTAIAGVIYAYIARGQDADADTHLAYQIEMFWITLGVLVLGLGLIFLTLGRVILIVLFVWSVFRMISGVLRIAAGKPINMVRYFRAWAV